MLARFGRIAASTDARLARRGAALATHTVLTAARYEIERTLAPRPRLEADTKKRLGLGVLRSIGMDVRVDGSLGSGERGRLVVANHRSAFDIALLLAYADDPIMLSRGDLAEWPVLGRLAKHGDTLFVDRDDRANGAKAIRAMRRVLASARTLCVFPEGTTHADPEVRPFQGGAFAAAHGLDVDVIPVGIAYSAGLEFVQPSMGAHVRHVMEQPTLRAALVVGEPMSSHAKRSSELAKRAHAEVAALAARATELVR